VVDRRQRGERAAGGVDVDVDVAVGIHRLQAQQLRHHVVGGGVIDRRTEEDDPLLEQLRVGRELLEPVRRPLGEGGEDVPPVLLAHLCLQKWGGQETAPADGTWLARVTTWSTKPYSFASSAVNHRSRSESFSICS